MGKRGPQFDWETLEARTEWPPVQADPLAPTPRRLPRWLGWGLAILVALLMPLLVEGYRIVRHSAQVITQVENELRAIAVAEDWIRAYHIPPHQTTAFPTSDSDNRQTPSIEVRNVEVRGDYAMVEVWTLISDKPWLPVPYRQMRFYHATEQGWQLTASPPDLFWQPLDTLQSGRFTFVYGPRDADAVLAAAHGVEEVDTELRRELGLPPTDEALTIKLFSLALPSVDPVVLARLSDDEEIFAPSPLFLPLPASISEEDALLQLVAGLLARRAVSEVLGDLEYACDWQPMAAGLFQWLLRAHSALPSQDRYLAESLLREQLAHDVLPRLAWFGPHRGVCMSDGGAQSAYPSAPTDAFVVPFMEYALSTYGRERLPALIEGMKRYDTWETLIPAVFGVSAAEFEAGWQEWLTENTENTEQP